MSELDERRRLKFLDIIEDIQIIITTTHKISIDGKENTYFMLIMEKKGRRMDKNNREYNADQIQVLEGLVVRVRPECILRNFTKRTSPFGL